MSTSDALYDVLNRAECQSETLWTVAKALNQMSPINWTKRERHYSRSLIQKFVMLQIRNPLPEGCQSWEEAMEGVGLTKKVCDSKKEWVIHDDVDFGACGPLNREEFFNRVKWTFKNGHPQYDMWLKNTLREDGDQDSEDWLSEFLRCGANPNAQENQFVWYGQGEKEDSSLWCRVRNDRHLKILIEGEKALNVKAKDLATWWATVNEDDGQFESERVKRSERNKMVCRLANEFLKRADVSESEQSLFDNWLIKNMNEELSNMMVAMKNLDFDHLSAYVQAPESLGKESVFQKLMKVNRLNLMEWTDQPEGIAWVSDMVRLEINAHALMDAAVRSRGWSIRELGRDASAEKMASLIEKRHFESWMEKQGKCTLDEQISEVSARWNGFANPFIVAIANRVLGMEEAKWRLDVMRRLSGEGGGNFLHALEITLHQNAQNLLEWFATDLKEKKSSEERHNSWQKWELMWFWFAAKIFQGNFKNLEERVSETAWSEADLRGLLKIMKTNERQWFEKGGLEKMTEKLENNSLKSGLCEEERKRRKTL
jgi:hypothetical protein